MNVAEKLVETLLEGEMPDWLKKKISGKTADDEGGDKDDEGGEEKAPKSEKSSSKKSSSGTDVASVTGKVSYSA